MALHAVPTAEPVSTPSLQHQFMKMPSAFALFTRDLDLELLCRFTDVTVEEESDRRSPEHSFAGEVVLETQTEELVEEREPTSSSSSEAGVQEGHAVAEGRKPTPETKSPVKLLQFEHTARRRWRATRKLASWTLASQLQQRNAASEGQKTAASALQSSHGRTFIFIVETDLRNGIFF